MMSSLNISIPDSLYHSLQELATQEQISIEQLVTSAISEKIAILTTDTYLQQRAKRGSFRKISGYISKSS
jgi:predicted transcriptional regulator